MRKEDLPKLATWNKEKEEWRCNACGSLIMGHPQILSMRTTTGPGFGETIWGVAPYCPKCEEVPSSYGTAYYDSRDDPDVQDRAVIAKMTEHL
jgi:hypothetical protein